MAHHFPTGRSGRSGEPIELDQVPGADRDGAVNRL